MISACGKECISTSYSMVAERGLLTGGITSLNGKRSVRSQKNHYCSRSREQRKPCYHRTHVTADDNRPTAVPRWTPKPISTCQHGNCASIS